MKIVGYARVSTRGQAKDGYSLEVQEQQLISAGASVVYKEVYTGKIIDRPVFQKMLETLEKDDILVITKLDRLARNTAEGLQTIKTLQARGIVIKIAESGTYIDASNNGELVLTVLFAVAQWERNTILQRMAEGLERARQKGVKFGRPLKCAPEQYDLAVSLVLDHGMTYGQAVVRTGIPRRTLFRKVKAERERRAKVAEDSNKKNVNIL